MPKNVDRPSAADFYKGITENIPDDKKVIENIVIGYVAGKIVKNAIKKRN
jgi:hypothetical protein